MALAVKSLKNGVLGTSSAGDIYGPVATGKAVVVKNIRLVNKTGTAVNNVNLYINTALYGQSRITPLNMTISCHPSVWSPGNGTIQVRFWCDSSQVRTAVWAPST